MHGQQIGSTVAAVFGLIYVMVNTGSLPTPWALILRVLAVLAFALVVLAFVRTPRFDGGRSPQRIFTRGYWIVVAVEFVALFVGARVLSGPLDAPEAGVAWVSFVVGVHFFPLGVVFKTRFYFVLGALITACGIAGIVLALLGQSPAAIDLVAGVTPGAILLGFGWWGMNNFATRAVAAA